MPTARGSARHCEAVEDHGLRLRSLVEAVEAVTSDGLITPEENRVLVGLIVATTESYAPLPGQASQQDGVLRWIGAVAASGWVSPYVTRMTRETVEDEGRLGVAA